VAKEKNSTASSLTAKINLALLYVRVSSKAQEDGFSLAAQEKLGHEYSQRKNLTIVKSWKVSESAWRSERAAFNLLIEYAKRHDEIKHIIFDVTDRMTRNDFDKLKIYTLIKEHGKTIHLASSNKVFDKNSGSEEEFMLDIEVAVAKKQSNDISRKTKMGMLEKAEQGLYPSVAPIGYKNNRLTHLIEVDEEKAPFIRKAFTLMASGSYSLAAIVKILNQEGLRGRKGYRVGKSAIEKILKNPIYYGAFRWQGRLRDGSHPQLVSKDLFDKACAVLHGNARPYTNRRGFAFNNLLTCGDCGCKVLGEEKKKRFVYYHCTFSKGRHNGRGYVPEREITRLFEPAVKAVTLDEEIVEWLQDALKESDKSSRRLSENRLNSLQNDLARANQRLSRLYDAKFDGDSIDEEVFKIKENEYKATIAEIKAQIRTLGHGNPNFYQDACRTLELSKRLFPLFLESSYEEKASILKLLASNYSLVNASDVSILPTYRRPFDIIAEGPSRLNWLPGRDSNPRPIG
jgi:site-specific DNA recombinase